MITNHLEIVNYFKKVKYKREGLLSHPVVAALIHDKWRSTYGILSIVHWVLYAAVYMVCTNSLLFTLPNPTSVLCTQGMQQNYIVIIDI